MRNIDKLIEIYFHICDCYDTDLALHYQRMSNNYSPKFTDEEVITIFLFGISKNDLISWTIMRRNFFF
ncbi:MAG: hypothetical protein ACI9LN_001997 [Saprospiraceae bacterium]|jgi:hypothetical protein